MILYHMHMFLHLKFHVSGITKKKFGPFVDQPTDVADAYSRNQPTPTNFTDGNHGESCTTGQNRLVQDASDIGLMMAHLSDGVIGVREVKGESTTAVKPPNVMANRGPPAVLSLEVYGSRSDYLRRKF